jgi:carboxypeptidase T
LPGLDSWCNLPWYCTWLGALAMPRYRITICGPDKAAMADLVRKYDIQVLEHGSRFDPDEGYTVAAFAAPDEILKLQQNGYQVVQLEDRDELEKVRRRQVGQGNRYTSIDESPAPAAYLNVDEVEAAIVAAAAPPFSAFAELINLPHPTWEGRQCHALKIGSGSGAGRTGVYFLGGVHAREWGSCDILVNFIERIEQAYLNGTALTFGGRTFSAAEIKSIVDTLDIVIFPQANPDGRQYSMTVDSDWRKNRRPAPDPQQQCPGVDLNRNYDFLWDFRKHFSPSAMIANSTDPCDDFYCGESAFSEPEARNARWIVDKFTNTRFFIDLHSYGKRILYRWGDAADQTEKPEMNFMNPAYDSVRGEDAYKEYIEADDLAASKSFAAALRGGIKAVRGTDYFIGPTYGLYATSGTVDDYFYSRHLTDRNQPKIMSYTLEWGEDFHPAYDEMRPIIDEVTAGLLAFCLEIAATAEARKAV